MLPPDDSELAKAYLENFESTPWYGLLGILGTYLFIGFVLIPSLEYYDVAVSFFLTKALIASRYVRYVGAIALLALSYYIYKRFRTSMIFVEAGMGVAGVLYQTYVLKSGCSMNTILGMLGSGFIAIHAFHTISDINQRKLIG